MYNFSVVSSSRFRNVIGDDLYNNHWNDYLTFLSGSAPTLSNSQIQTTEQWLVDCENSTSGSDWFQQLQTNGYF